MIFGTYVNYGAKGPSLVPSIPPRGMLEFWADPESPYHREIFASGKQLVFYCASAWRSALATKALQDMGVPNVAHMAGGFSKWKELNLPINPVEKNRRC